MKILGSFESYTYAFINLNGGLVDFIHRDRFDGMYHITNPMEFDAQISEDDEIMIKFNDVISHLKSEFSVTFG